MKNINYQHNLVFVMLILSAFATSVSAQILPQVCTLRGTLGTAPPLGATGTLATGIRRSGSANATCSSTTIPSPFNEGSGSFLYNTHTLRNPTIFPICVPVRLTKTNPSVSGADLQVAVFQTPFAAGDITNSARFRGDAGASTGAFSLHQPTTFNVVIPGNSTVALVVYNTVNNSTAAEPYQLDFCTATINSTNSPIAIPDNNPNGINTSLSVPTSGRISDLNFRFTTGAGACTTSVGNINAAVDHTFVGDLTFRLTAPNGFSSATFMERRGGTRENICSTLIDDDGNLPLLSTITNQTGQFVSGSFASETTGRLSRFDGINPQGNWFLNVSDNVADDTGSLRRFALEITTYPQKAPFDYDGDLRSDVAVFRPNTGYWWILRSADGSASGTVFGLSTDIVTPGDFTGDGKDEIAVFRPSNGTWYFLRSEDNSFYAIQFGTNGDIPVPADYDGDTFTDVAIYRPSTNLWAINKSSGGTDYYTFGTSGDKPVQADYDGDGKSDIAIYRPSTGQWWIQRSRQGILGISFGIATDKPVPGDYTGDGKADIAVFRPSQGTWYFLRSENSSFYAQAFGLSSDVPAPGDFDGDGKFDVAVFRPEMGTWYMNRSLQGFSSVQFGAFGDIPIPSSGVR